MAPGIWRNVIWLRCLMVICYPDVLLAGVKTCVVMCITVFCGFVCLQMVDFAIFMVGKSDFITFVFW